MKAILLAAGKGERLLPITEVLPKCLVPILGVPLLEIWLKILSEMQISEVIINTSYKAPLVEEFLFNYRKTTSLYQNMMKITQVYEPNLLGTGGTLLKNISFFDNQDLLVIHADNLSFFDSKIFLDTFNNRPKSILATMMTFKTDNPKTCGIVEIDSQNVVQKLFEKVPNPPGDLANAAVYLFSKELIKEFSMASPFSDISLELLPQLMVRMNTYFNDVYHQDIGNIKAYLNTNQDLVFLNSNYNRFFLKMIRSPFFDILWENWVIAWSKCFPKLNIFNNIESAFEYYSTHQISEGLALIKQFSETEKEKLIILKNQNPDLKILIWEKI